MKTTILLIPNLLSALGVLAVYGLKSAKAEICQNFYPDMPYKAFLLPSEIPKMSCRCVGVVSGQACPVWEFLEGMENVFDLVNETRRDSSISCTSYFQFRVRPDADEQWNTYNFTVKCSAVGNERTARLLIKKSLNNYMCNEDEDCLLENQKCQVRGHCPRKDCSKVCQCVDPLPVFVDKSPQNCYSRSSYGDACNYTLQCEDTKVSVVCSMEEGAGNGSSGVCRCPDGFSYNGRHRDCMEILDGEPPKQSLSERIMIAVCCGIVGIFIFVFVSHICKRHFRHRRRRQDNLDTDQDESFSQPLSKRLDISDKPPSYQESQKIENPISQHAQPLREAPSSSAPEITSAHPLQDASSQVQVPVSTEHSAPQPGDHKTTIETDF